MTSNTTNYHKVGWVSDAHGLKGEVYVRLDAKKADWLAALATVRLETVDYAVLAKSAHKDGLILKLAGVADRTAAELLKGQKVLIPKGYLHSTDGEAPYLDEILGFEVIDERLGSLGPVLKFDSNGAQDLLVVKPGRDEQLIPFVQEFVQELNMDKKQILMDLPEGLVELAL
jgi:16S rRNA processing protein RimM